MTTGGSVRALDCDEYLLVMAQSFWRRSQNQTAHFELTIRDLPRNRGYLVAAGLENALDYLAEVRVTPEMLEWMRASRLYDDGFLEMLADWRFDGDVHAVDEGTVVGAGIPLLRVSAPRISADLVESALLAIVTHETMVASKAARVVDAAAGRPVWDFSMRRLHGVEIGAVTARAAYIAGCTGTATVAAGVRYGIPVSGTMAHHFVQSFGPEREQAAFEQFLRDYPHRATLLVDTFDTLRGVERAIAASRATGVALGAVRLDSGDLAALSVAARRLLDDAGMNDTKILVSGDLDEWRIESLLAGGGAVDSFGVGTRMGVSDDVPHINGIYKLVAQDTDAGTEPVMKLSRAKITDPGIHQVFRGDTGDVIALDGERLEGTPLLHPVMRGGQVLRPRPTLEEIRTRCAAQRAALPAAARRLDDPIPRPVRRSAALIELRRRLQGGASMTETSHAGSERTALICTDVQRDFLPGGALAVAGGDAVVAPLRRIAAGFDLVIATRDFHPAGHCSFRESGGPWPVHCVAGTSGAEILPEIDALADVVVSKGRDPHVDAYSAFDGTGLGEVLRGHGVTRLVIGGLTTDYCVRATALDAVKAGFATTVIREAVRAVDVEPGDGDRAIAEMEAAGVSVVPSWAPHQLAGAGRRGAR